MHTLVSKLVALSVEKYYMALTEIQLKICRFHGFLSQKGSRRLTYEDVEEIFKKKRNLSIASASPTGGICVKPLRSFSELCEA